MTIPKMNNVFAIVTYYVAKSDFSRAANDRENINNKFKLRCADSYNGKTDD
ncbi:MAG TPA: hypothetical protein VGK02_08850 [Candidatus Aquicultor sp.]